MSTLSIDPEFLFDPLSGVEEHHERPSNICMIVYRFDGVLSRGESAKTAITPRIALKRPGLVSFGTSPETALLLCSSDAVCAAGVRPGCRINTGSTL
jgi:hypothetical protein